jgi:DNA-binding phage protein
MKDKPHDEAMAELYREEPDFAIATLNAVVLGGDQAELMVVLRQMTTVFGDVQATPKWKTIDDQENNLRE